MVSTQEGETTGLQKSYFIASHFESSSSIDVTDEFFKLSKGFDLYMYFNFRIFVIF